MKRLLSFISMLLAVIMLAGCSGLTEYTTELLHRNDEAEEEETEEEAPVITETSINVSTDNVFGVVWDSSSSFNPITSASLNNQNLKYLVYEGLFQVETDYTAQPVLCESFTVSDDLTVYTFKIRQGVKFHDGTELTSADVVYSINQAWNTEGSVYNSRFHALNAVFVLDDYSFEIDLGSPYEQLELILDIPIIPDGSIDTPTPAGTGPYKLDTEYSILTRNTSWWQNKELPLNTIYLQESQSLDDLRDDFETSRVDFLTFDPTGTTTAAFHNDYETFEYESTVLQYVGFNFYSDIFCYEAARKAVCYAVDRDYIVENIYDKKADAAILPCQKNSRLYNDSIEAKYGYDESKIMENLLEGGFEDYGESGLMYIETSTMMQPCQIDFIVNSENAYKVQAAEKIAETLEKNGFVVGLRTLPYDEYLEALNLGDFDMYLAEVKLTADFDLTALLNFNGYLNYGDATCDELNATVRASLENSGAALDLYTDIYEHGLIVPVLFKRYVVLAPRGLLVNASSTPTDPFHNFSDWTITID